MSSDDDAVWMIQHMERGKKAGRFVEFSFLVFSHQAGA
jgi:hypothetical protein